MLKYFGVQLKPASTLLQRCGMPWPRYSGSAEPHQGPSPAIGLRRRARRGIVVFEAVSARKQLECAANQPVQGIRCQ